MARLLQSVNASDSPPGEILWSLHYVIEGLPAEPLRGRKGEERLDHVEAASASTPALASQSASLSNVTLLPPPSLDLAFDDTTIDNVKAIWMRVMGREDGDGEDFMKFDNREVMQDE